MELMFNEQSVVCCAANHTEACSAVIQFVQTYKEAEKHDFKRIRYEKSFDQIEIAPKFTLNDFCCSPNLRIWSSLLLGLAKHPYIDNNSSEEQRFIDNNFYIERNNRRIQVEGLGVAYLYKSFGISFCFDSYWNQIKHKLYVEGPEKGEYEIIAISHPKHCEDADFIIQKDLWKPLCLVKSQTNPENKIIHLREDHGQDQLYDFAKRIRRSPYVEQIVNSLPYNPQESNFIRTVKANGLIEIVLTGTDKGLGLVLQSTGRNIRETKEIARILEEEFS